MIGVVVGAGVWDHTPIPSNDTANTPHQHSQRNTVQVSSSRRVRGPSFCGAGSGDSATSPEAQTDYSPSAYSQTRSDLHQYHSSRAIYLPTWADGGRDDVATSTRTRPAPRQAVQQTHFFPSGAGLSSPIIRRSSVITPKTEEDTADLERRALIMPKFSILCRAEGVGRKGANWPGGMAWEGRRKV